MAASTEITYEFGELPLLSDLGREGLYVCGRADIGCYDEDDWVVRAIWLDDVEIEKDAMPWLWNKVVDALYTHRDASIIEQVRAEDFGISQRLRWRAA